MIVALAGTVSQCDDYLRERTRNYSRKRDSHCAPKVKTVKPLSEPEGSTHGMARRMPEPRCCVHSGHYHTQSRTKALSGKEFYRETLRHKTPFLLIIHSAPFTQLHYACAPPSCTCIPFHTTREAQRVAWAQRVRRSTFSIPVMSRCNPSKSL